MLQLEPWAGFVVGLKLSPGSIAAAVTDLQANVLHYLELPHTVLADPASTIHALIHAIERAIHESAVQMDKVLGMGVGMSGVIDSPRGICRYSPILNWNDVQVAQPIGKHFDLPVFVDNNVNTLTIAEQWFGQGKGIQAFVVITIILMLVVYLFAQQYFVKGVVLSAQPDRGSTPRRAKGLAVASRGPLSRELNWVLPTPGQISSFLQ